MSHKKHNLTSFSSYVVVGKRDSISYKGFLIQVDFYMVEIIAILAYICS